MATTRLHSLNSASFSSVHEELNSYITRLDANEKRMEREQTLHTPDFVKALAEEQLRLNELAIAAYQRATELNPTDTETLKNYGKLLAHLDRYEQALIPLSKALQLDPVDLDTQLFIMRLELSLGRSEALLVQW